MESTKSKYQQMLNMFQSSSPSVLASIVVVCASSFGTMFSMMSLETTMLLYMNSVGFTSETDTSFFVKTQAIGFMVPIAASAILGHIANKYGAKRTLTFSYIIVLMGYGIMFTSKRSTVVFMLGYVCYVICSAFRIIRYSIIAEIVPIQHRTIVMAIHQFATPLGFLCAPVVWLFVQRQQVTLPLGNTLDRFDLNFILCMIVTFIITVLISMKLNYTSSDVVTYSNHPLTSSHEEEGEGGELSETKQEDSKLHLQLESKDDERREIMNNRSSNKASYESISIVIRNGERIDKKKYSLSRFVFFTCIILFTRFTFETILCIFQPVLIGYFRSTDREMGVIYLVIGVVSLVPPIVVAYLSTCAVSDREILTFGILLKLAGALMFLPLPLFGTTMHRWQPILGYIMVIKASSFVTTSTISLFTKVMGPLSSTKTLGYLWSASNFLPAVVQLLFPKQIVATFSSWAFSIFVIPTAVAACMVVSPVGRNMLSEASDTIFI